MCRQWLERESVKRIQIGLKGPTGYLRADSDALSNSDAEQQLATIANAKEKGPDSLIRLPWIALLASDVLFARTVDIPASPAGAPTPSLSSARTATKAAARRTSRAAKK
jgi:hypothetical protein